MKPQGPRGTVRVDERMFIGKGSARKSVTGYLEVSKQAHAL